MVSAMDSKWRLLNNMRYFRDLCFYRRFAHAWSRLRVTVLGTTWLLLSVFCFVAGSYVSIIISNKARNKYSKMTDWKVPCSDDELAGDGDYEPLETDVIIQLYEAIQRGEIPLFETKIYPRKEPAAEKEASPETQKVTEQTPEKAKTPVEATEFDFDTQPEDNVKRFTPRRTPNRPTTKKVARMANVYSDIMKYGKMEDGKKKEEQPQAN